MDVGARGEAVVGRKETKAFGQEAAMKRFKEGQPV